MLFVWNLELEQERQRKLQREREEKEAERILQEQLERQRIEHDTLREYGATQLQRVFRGHKARGHTQQLRIQKAQDEILQSRRQYVRNRVAQRATERAQLEYQRIKQLNLAEAQQDVQCIPIQTQTHDEEDQNERKLEEQLKQLKKAKREKVKLQKKNKEE